MERISGTDILMTVLVSTMVCSLLVLGAFITVAEQMAYGDGVLYAEDTSKLTVEWATDWPGPKQGDDFLFEASCYLRDDIKHESTRNLSEILPTGAGGLQIDCSSGLVDLYRYPNGGEMQTM
ncbi:MAG: hypothetical protein ACYTEQ_22845 [Planctomycetota bacterium]|jgi:hypothetical protein